jgi:hypothetical protein
MEPAVPLVPPLLFISLADLSTRCAESTASREGLDRKDRLNMAPTRVLLFLQTASADGFVRMLRGETTGGIRHAGSRRTGRKARRDGQKAAGAVVASNCLCDSLRLLSKRADETSERSQGKKKRRCGRRVDAEKIG